MTDFIGHLIANWPFWAVITAVILVGIAWFFLMVFEAGPLFGRNHEWEEDRQKRIARQLEKTKAKLAMKAKKG